MTNAPIQGNANPVVRYFHGGDRGLKVGDYILPPSDTGRPSVSDFGAQIVHRKDRVYVSTRLGDAQFFASASQKPVVYEVEPEGDLAPDPDCISGVSFTCSKAKIIAVHKIRGKIIKKHQKAMKRA
jgi:rifampin ADP-ribosylating transferase